MLEKLKNRLEYASHYSKWATTAFNLRAALEALPFTAPVSLIGGAMLAGFAHMLMGGATLTAIGATAGFLSVPFISYVLPSTLKDVFQQHKTVTFENGAGQVIQSTVAQRSALNKVERNINDLSRLLECAESEAKCVPLRTDLSKTFTIAKNIAQGAVVLEAGQKGASPSEYSFQKQEF